MARQTAKTRQIEWLDLAELKPDPLTVCDWNGRPVLVERGHGEPVIVDGHAHDFSHGVH